jgi:hypothetical protein
MMPNFTLQLPQVSASRPTFAILHDSAAAIHDYLVFFVQILDRLKRPDRWLAKPLGSADLDQPLGAWTLGSANINELDRYERGWNVIVARTRRCHCVFDEYFCLRKMIFCC